MLANIDGLANICTMFSVFHDGVITYCARISAHLELGIEIEYLAERINPVFSVFRVTLENIEEPYFIPWPDDANVELAIITDVEAISTADLEIQSCETENSVVKVHFRQSVSGRNAGGCLYLKSKSAIVKDEGGKQYSIEELVSLSNGYWNEWASKHENI